MIRLENALNAWGTPSFNEVLKTEIEALTAEELPLQQGLSSGSYALDNKIKVMIISVSEDNDIIRVKTGIFYTGIIAGCNCADDPSPADEQTEYCVVQVDIDKATAETEITLSNE